MTNVCFEKNLYFKDKYNILFKESIIKETRN